jgi:peptidoglycan hydrolase-like protein with peptidoglycan-binding domain
MPLKAALIKEKSTRRRNQMKKIAIALVTTAVIGVAAFAASNNNPQQPQGAQRTQPQNNNQAQQPNQQNRQQNAQGRNQPNNQQAAQNVSPQNMPRRRIIIVQRALDRSGFNTGKADGRWGPRTEGAVKQFQQSKQIQPTGQLDRQTVADLGLDTSRFQQSPQNQR